MCAVHVYVHYICKPLRIILLSIIGTGFIYLSRNWFWLLVGSNYIFLSNLIFEAHNGHLLCKLRSDEVVYYTVKLKWCQNKITKLMIWAGNPQTIQIADFQERHNNNSQKFVIFSALCRSLFVKKSPVIKPSMIPGILLT